jgi:hypothetical protein
MQAPHTLLSSPARNAAMGSTSARKMKVWTISPVLLLSLAVVIRLAITTMGAPSNRLGPQYRITPIKVSFFNALIMSAAVVIMGKPFLRLVNGVNIENNQEKNKPRRKFFCYARRA